MLVKGAPGEHDLQTYEARNVIIDDQVSYDFSHFLHDLSHLADPIQDW